MNTSLSKFCKDHGLAKSTVYDRCRELKFDTSIGLTPAMVAQLEHEFNLVPSAKPEPPTVRPEVMPENFFQSSELAPVQPHEIQLPQGFDPSAMVKFFDGVAGEDTDTGSLLAIADMAINAAKAAMDSKIESQRQRLTKAQEDAAKLDEKISEAKTDLKVKALESRILAGQQTAATKTAEEKFAELMALGKPPAESSPPSA